jgi:uncharacterized protein (UPF0332 family)
VTKEEKTIISYRMECANETLREAQLLFEAGHLRAYVNRLYYACFYAVSALLLTINESTSKHSHLRSLLHREFVKTGSIPIELGKHFDLLFDSRQEGDYVDFVTFRAEEIEPWFERTKRFIESIDYLIQKAINQSG